MQLLPQVEDVSFLFQNSSQQDYEVVKHIAFVCNAKSFAIAFIFPFISLFLSLFSFCSDPYDQYGTYFIGHTSKLLSRL